MNPLPVEEKINRELLLDLIRQIFECIEQDGTGHIPEIQIVDNELLIVTFENTQSFRIYISELSDLN